MNKENFSLKLVDEIILYYDARSKKHQIELRVFRGNPFQAHSLEQSYHPTQPFKRGKITQIKKCKGKNNIKFIYLTFIHCTCKFEKHK